MDWIEIIIALVALYGALLSTWNFVQNIRSRKRKLTVQIEKGRSASGQDIIIMRIKNPPGYATVTFDSPQFILPNDKIVMIGNPLNGVRFPYELTGGNHCPIIYLKQDVERGAKSFEYSGVIELRAKVVDGADKAYISKTPFKLDLS